MELGRLASGSFGKNFSRVFGSFKNPQKFVLQHKSKKYLLICTTNPFRGKCNINKRTVTKTATYRHYLGKATLFSIVGGLVISLVSIFEAGCH